MDGCEEGEILEAVNEINEDISRIGFETGDLSPKRTSMTIATEMRDESGTRNSLQRASKTAHKNRKLNLNLKQHGPRKRRNRCRASFWNVRGFNQISKHSLVRQWVKQGQFQFGSLIETLG